MYLRRLGYRVEFEVPLGAARLPNSTRPAKFNLDLLVTMNERFGIELKVPLSGRHPETMYDFCADIEFLESLKRAGSITRGICLMATDDRAFWTDSGRGSAIHDSFRTAHGSLCGTIQKPTGGGNTSVQLEATYRIATAWRAIGGESLLSGGRYALLEV